MVSPSTLNYDSENDRFLVNGRKPTEGQVKEIAEFISVVYTRPKQARLRFQLPGTAGFYVSKKSFQYLREINPDLPLPLTSKAREQPTEHFKTVPYRKSIRQEIDSPLTLALENIDQYYENMKKGVYDHLEKANKVRSKEMWWGTQYRGPNGQFISPESELAQIHEYNCLNIFAHLTLFDKSDKSIRDFEVKTPLTFPYQEPIGGMKAGFEKSWIEFIELLTDYFGDSEKYMWWNYVETRLRVKEITGGF